MILLLLLQLFIGQIQSYDYQNGRLKRYEFTHSSMGSLFRIICYAKNEHIVHELSLKAFGRIDTLNRIMSDYLPDSELNLLSRSSGSQKAVPVSQELFTIIQLSQYWSEVSSGAFDITVGIYSQIWRRAGRKEALPDPDEIQYASERVGYNYIVLNAENRSIRLTQPGMQLDLGGIAKGYAIDMVFEIFKDGGIDMVLVDGAGDIRTGNPPPGQDGWKVLIETLEKGKRMVEISNRAIATSGDLYRFVKVGDEKYSHIIDPKTGYGIKTPRTVTIESETATQADALASIVSVLGPDSGFELLNKQNNVQCIIIQEVNGNIEKWESGKLNYIDEIKEIPTKE